MPELPHWAQQRRYELDTLRVLAFALLVFYHLGMAYVADWGWHIKSLYQSETLQYLMRWSNQWRMSLLFLISGAALSYQLYRDSSWRFLPTISARLLLPLAFGSLVIVAPQAYVEAKMAGAIDTMSYLEFWRHYLGYPWFGEPLPAYTRFASSNVIWNHLWYLPYLCLYALVLWLIYPLFRQARFIQLSAKLAQHLPLPLLYLAPALVLFALGQWLWAAYPTTHKLIDDWHNHARYFTFFMLGFALVRSNRLWCAIGQLRHLSLLLALLCYALISFYVAGGNLASYLPLLQWLEDPVRGFVWSSNTWLWLLAIVGYGQAWLNRPWAWVGSANRAVYCWYILHQTLIVLALYGLRPYELGPIGEPLVVVLLTWGGCLLGYQVFKPIAGVRRLMGITSRQGNRT